MERSEVYRAIDSEREYQDAKWGTVEENPHSINEWLFIINHYWCKATEIHNPDALNNLRKIAAVAIAALEQHGCPTREADTEPQ